MSSARWSSSRAAICSGDRSLTRAAASSMASGIPCSRAVILPTAGALASVSSKAGRTERARATNSWAEFEPLQRCRGHGAQFGRQIQSLELRAGATGPVAQAVRARRTPARRRRAGRSGWRRGSAGPASARASRAAPGPRRSPARSCRGRTAPGRRPAPRRCRRSRTGSPCRSRRSCARSSARPAPVHGPAPAGRTRPRRGSRRRRRPRSAATDASCRCHPAR